MNSRLENLVKKFNLKNKYYEDKIDEKFLNCDYAYIDTILDIEREKAKKFLLNAFDVTVEK